MSNSPLVSAGSSARRKKRAPRKSKRPKPIAPPRYLLVHGSGHDEDALDTLRAACRFDLEIHLPAPGGESESLEMWEALGRSTDRKFHAKFRRLAILVDAIRPNTDIVGSSAIERAFQALRYSKQMSGTPLTDKDSKRLSKLIDASTDEGSIGMGGIEFSPKYLARLSRWLRYGPELAQFIDDTSTDGRWDVDEARKLQGAIDKAENRSARREQLRTDLNRLLRLAFLEDCRDGGAEIVFADYAPGDQAAQLKSEFEALNQDQTASAYRAFHEHTYGGSPSERPDLTGRTGQALTTHAWEIDWTYVYVKRAHLLNPDPEGRGAKSRRRLIAVIAAAAVLAIGTGIGIRYVTDDSGPGSLTDGGSCPSPEHFQRLCGLILAQNNAVDEAVEAGAERFTVVVALPLTFDGNDTNDPREIRGQLEGALAAQALRNDANPQMQVQLLLADLGSSNASWESAAEAITEAKDEERIVAVTGMGSSLSTTRDFINTMAAQQIVTIGSVITGDNMLSTPIGVGYSYRVSPTNSQEAVAITSSIREGTDPCATRILYDADAQSATGASANDYIRTLSDGYLAWASGLDCETPPVAIGFERGSIDFGGSSPFAEQVRRICQDLAGDVSLLWAGRSRQDLPALIASLSQRDEFGDCASHEITILSGDDLSHITYHPDLVDDMHRANIELHYIGLAHPEQWDEHRGEEGYVSYSNHMYFLVDQLERLLGGTTDLENGQAIMQFDAFYLAASAAQEVAKDGTLTTQGLATHLATKGPFPGASGSVAFDELGNPVGKAMVLLRATGVAEHPLEIIEVIEPD